jgi:transcriptional regulator with GAF, ATPase, and Fis domain
MPPRFDSTLPSPRRRDGGGDAPVPRLLAVWLRGRPACNDRPLADDTPLVVGRGDGAGLVLDDPSVSRQHAEIGFDGAMWTIRDLGSRNGSFVDGKRIRGELLIAAPRVVRLGDCVLLPRDDLNFDVTPPDVDGTRVLGARVRRVWQTIASLADVGPSLYIRGESGSGKELAARELHRCTRPRGPFVAVNCAAIPEPLAEALLFGARRGAYSGAVEASEGYIRAADGGVLFLDEIGELSPAVQGKLLRALESRSVVPVGDTQARPVDLRLCVATHHDLRELVRAGRFREDLYYRIGRPMIELPPLRQRLEDLPWLIAGVLRELDPALACDAELIAACALRPWRGNLRELLTELRVAGQSARLRGSARVELVDLAPDAGQAIDLEDEPRDAAPRLGLSVGQRRQVEARSADIEARRDAITDALRSEQGNVTRAAQRLGVHRTQLKRWLARLDLDPDAFARPSPK